MVDCPGCGDNALAGGDNASGAGLALRGTSFLGLRLRYDVRPDCLCAARRVLPLFTVLKITDKHSTW